MRSFAEVTVAIALVGFVAALTLFSIVAAFDAAITVRFTTFGTDDSILVASEWGPCDDFQSASCG
jgi:hypothetical protein